MTEEWLDRHRRQMAYASAGLFLLALGVGLWARHVGALPGERWVIDAFFATSGEDELISETTGFFVGTGAPPIVVLIVGLTTWLAFRELRSFVWLVPLTLVAPALALLAKDLGGVTIPMAEVRGLPVGMSPSTLPSAHSAYAAALFGLIVVLCLLRRRRDLALFAAVVGLAIGPSTIINGSHVPSDVVCGYALGSGWLALLLAFRPRSEVRGVIEAAQQPAPVREHDEARN